MPEKLKPCPACGCIAPRMKNLSPYKLSPPVGVWCPDCLMEVCRWTDGDEAVRVWNALPRRLRWTKEPPKDPGWYWHQEDRGGKHPAHVFRVVTSGGETGVYVRFFGQPADVVHKIDHISGKWAGPIPEPEEQ